MSPSVRAERAAGRVQLWRDAVYIYNTYLIYVHVCVCVNTLMSMYTYVEYLPTYMYTHTHTPLEVFLLTTMSH